MTSARTATAPRRRPDPRVVMMTGPFAGTPERVFDLDRPRTISDVIRRNDIAFRLPTIAVVVGKGEPVPVLRKDWTTRKIKRGEILTFVAVPGRGGSGSGKQIIAIVASIALAIAAPFAGAAIAGALGLGALGTQIASAAFLVGGSLLLNALLAPPRDTPKEGEQVYTANASSNRIALLEPVPVLYGRLRYPPPLAAQPYSEFSGNDQYLYQLHCISCGVADVQRWEIGDTLAWTDTGGFEESFDDVEIEIIQPGDDITLFPANVVTSGEVSGQAVPGPDEGPLGPFTVNIAGTQISRIAVDFVFPVGLHGTAGDGGMTSRSRNAFVEYRQIDDDGDAVGDWTLLFNETFNLETTTPQRFSRGADVAAGRYQVRFGSSNSDSENPGNADTLNWVGLRGYLTNWDVPENVTLVATKIRANDQLGQASASQYFFTSQRHLPIYDSDTDEWSSPAATSAIAWAAADLLRNADYGLALADSLFDLDWLAAYAETWADRDDEFNALFDRKWVAHEALNAILRCGRSQAVRIGGQIGFVRAEPKDVKRAVFTPRNIVTGTFQRRFVLFDDEAPDHVVAKYLDRNSWQEREVTAAISSVGEAEPQERDYFGITDRDHAWREAIFDAACNAYQREFVTFQSEWEGKLIVRGDPILIHGPLFRGVHMAALVGRDDDDLTIDRDFTPDVDTAYYVVLRGKDGKEWGPVLVDAFSDRVLSLNAVSRLSAEANHGLLSAVIPGDTSELAHALICEEQIRPFDGLVVSAVPDGPHRVSILAVKDDQRVHLADETEITPAPYTPPSLFTPAPEAPSIDTSTLYAFARNGTVHIELEAGWQPAAGAQRYVAEISYDEDASTLPASASWTPVHDSVATRFTAPIIPQSWTLRVAAIGIRQGLWSYKTGTSPTPALPPAIVTQDSLNDLLAAFMANVEESLPNDLLLLREEVNQLATALNTQVTVIREALGRINIGAGARYNENKASAELAIAAAADANEALAALFVDLFAESASGVAQGLIRFVAASAPEGAIASFAIECRSSFEGEFGFAGFYMDVGSFTSGATSRIRLVADQISLDIDGSVADASLFVLGGEPVEVAISAGIIRPSFTTRRTLFETELSENATYRIPTGAAAGYKWEHIIRQDATGSRTLSFEEDELFGDAPTIGTTAEETTVLDGIIMRGSPLRMLVTERITTFEGGTPDFAFVDAVLTEGTVKAFSPVNDALGQAGELMIVAVVVWASEDPADWTPIDPEGWTFLGGDSVFGGSNGLVMRVYMRRLNGAETGDIAFVPSDVDVIIGGSEDASGVYAIRVTGGGIVSFGSVNTEGTSDNPSSQSVPVSTLGIAEPIIVFGFAASAPNSGATGLSMSPAADQDSDNTSFSGAQSTRFRVMLKFFDDLNAPADVTVDANDAGNTNVLISGYIKG